MRHDPYIGIKACRDGSHACDVVESWFVLKKTAPKCKDMPTSNSDG